MIPRIECLTEAVVNQIAAGEVIERPASVIKELVENSLDAEAKHLKIQIQGGGSRLIEVLDDGLGMHPDDLNLSLIRGATSKLRNVEDLMRLSSMGFRGEAMASIASVSKLTLTTRRQEDAQGQSLYALGGLIEKKKSCGVPPGTCVRVEDLFFNVPARKHFLKKPATEAAQIQATLRNYCLARPDIAFTFSHGNQTFWHVSPCNTLMERVTELWGLEWAQSLKPVSTQAFDLELSGLLGGPHAPEASRGEQIFWVNDRPIDASLIRRVLKPTGRQNTPFFLKMQIDPALVDVNVHPAKREVRFRHESEVVEFLKTSLAPESKPHLNTWGPDPLIVPFRSGPKGYALSEPPAPQWVPSQSEAPKPPPSPLEEKAPSSAKKGDENPQESAPLIKTEVFDETLDHDFTFVGTFQKNAYALWESQQGLVVMDIKASWGRIYLEQFLSETKQPSQALVFSEQLTLDPVATELLMSIEPQLRQAGFELESFGKNTFRIFNVPLWLNSSAADFLKKTIFWLQQDQGRPAKALCVQLCLAQLASEQARSNKNCDFHFLLQALWQTSTPTQGPTGAATFWVLTPQLLRRFLER